MVLSQYFWNCIDEKEICVWKNKIKFEISLYTFKNYIVLFINISIYIWKLNTCTKINFLNTCTKIC